MSVSVTVAGTSYTIPQTGETSWGNSVTAWIQAISAVTLQTTGGSFTLTSDLNFGGSFGVISLYYKSVSANIAQSGAIRLANTDGIAWRNSGNSADLVLKPDADGILQYGGVDLVTLSATQTLTNKTLTSPVIASLTPDGSHTLTMPTFTDTFAVLAAAQTLTNKTIAAGSNTISGLTNSNLSGSAGISNANLASMNTLTLKGNNTGGGATPSDLTVSQVNTMLGTLSNPMTTAGDLIVGGSSGTPTRLGIGSSPQVLGISTGSPAWVTLTPPTKTLETSTGSTVGYVFTVSGITVAPTAGATYTNNTVTFTIIGTTNSNTLIWATSAGAPTASGTLTKSTGTGDSTISFSAEQTIASYSVPAGALWLKITGVGGGASGGGTTTAASDSAAAGGGGGGGAFIKWLSVTGGSTYYYTVGALGAAASSGNHNGNPGTLTGFGTGTSFYVGFGGSGGSASVFSSVAVVGGPGGVGGSAAGGDLNIPGCPGGGGISLSGSQALSGYGGDSGLGFGSGGVGYAAGNTGNGSNGSAGTGYGAGGSGGANINNNGATSGSAGTAGVLIIEEFYT